MDSLSNSLTFIINKELELILDNISLDYSIERQDLNKYLLNNSKKSSKNEKSIATDIPLEGGSGVCQGKTKKGESCPNKAKNGTTFCGKHTP
jgi:hypothetical protein